MKCDYCGAKVESGQGPLCPSCGRPMIAAGEATTQIPSEESMEARGTLVFQDLLFNKRFKILKMLGKGGMGVIYQAKDLKLKREVAIKCISGQTLSDNRSRARFLREAQTASQLEHTNICMIYEIYEEENNNYIVMQYVDGITLDHIISLKQLSLGKVLDIAIQVCEGIIEAHSKEIIHRDIKPGNIMIDQRGVVKILDFGLAKFRDESLKKKQDKIDSTNLTEKGIVLGTVSYMSPEQAKGQEIDFRSDIFSFGVILYEMLEGSSPFQEDDHISTLYNVLNKEIAFSRKLPLKLKNIIKKAIAKKKTDRYNNFNDLKKDLAAVQSKYRVPKNADRADLKTEVISSEDHRQMMAEVKKSSEKEGLGDIVYKIKKLKARTEKVPSTRGRHLRNWGIWLLLSVLTVTGIIILRRGDVPFLSRETGETFYVYLRQFENYTREKDLDEKISFLLSHALNQFQEFKTIDEEAASSIVAGMPAANVPTDPGAGDGDSPPPGTAPDANILSRLRTRFDVQFELEGTIRELNNFYNIDAVLRPVAQDGKSYSITIPVLNKDTLLSHMIDTLVKRIYFSMFGDRDYRDLIIKKTGKIYGLSWDVFSLYHRGMIHHKKLESSRAEYFLKKCQDLPASKYLLADLHYFNGDRQEAIDKLEEIKPDLENLTEYLKLKVLALQARLSFNFSDEINHLLKLKKGYPFSKEVFFALGEAYFHHGRADKAIIYYNQALELENKFSKAINHLGYCHAYLGDHNKAIELFEDYRNLDQSANSFDSLGDGYFYSGDLVSAEVMKQAAVARDRRSVPYSYLTLADIHIHKARFSEVGDFLRQYRSIRRNKKAAARAMTKEGYSLWVRGDSQGALRMLNQSLHTYDSDDINEDPVAEAHWLRGWVLLSLDRLADGKKDLEWLEVLKNNYNLSPSNFYIPYKYLLHLKAMVAEKEGDMERCEALLKNLVEMKTQLSYWITHFNYQFFHAEFARFLMRHRRYEDALQEVERCLEYNPNYIPALWVKAEIFDKQGRADCLQVYRRISELYGESTETNRFREELRKKLASKG